MTFLRIVGLLLAIVGGTLFAIVFRFLWKTQRHLEQYGVKEAIPIDPKSRLIIFLYVAVFVVGLAMVVWSFY